MFNISDTTLRINERFFEAVDLLKRKRTLGGLSAFAKRYHVVLGNLYTIKTQQSGAIKAEYLHYLVRDYGISAEWLLTGEGDMFRQNSSRNEESPTRETSSSSGIRKSDVF